MPMTERTEWQWRRGYQLMARNMAFLIPVDAPKLTDFGRAHGECICQKCGLEYLEHPTAPGNTVDVQLCDGKQVHL